MTKLTLVPVKLSNSIKTNYIIDLIWILMQENTSKILAMKKLSLIIIMCLMTPTMFLVIISLWKQ
jgi:hypothetical protein